MLVVAKTTKKNLKTPDETRTFPKGKFEVLNVGELVLGRATFEPGWKWSESVKPIAKTESCAVHHSGWLETGRLRIRMDDGTETDLRAGDAFVIDAGHDAWVVGNEPCVVYEFSGAASYARR